MRVERAVAADPATIKGYRNVLRYVESLARVARSACHAEEASITIEDVGRAIDCFLCDLVDVIKRMEAAIERGPDDLGAAV